jgi:hypothetical protein
VSNFRPSPARRVPPPYPLARLIALAAVAACSRGDSQPVARESADGGSAPSARPSPRVLDSVSGPYVAVAVTDGGTIRGTVEIEGEAPADTSVRTGRDERVCGATLVDRSVVRQGDRLGGAVVWLSGLRRGKALPTARRYEVTLERCQLTPRAQAVLAGGTLNVRSRDPLQTRFRFVRQPAGETIGFVTENDDGQVVPVERVLRVPGQVDVRNDTHPWVRGFLFIFDQPYFATTPPAGTFSLDDVPAGSYRLSAWHERFGRVDTTITVQPGQTADVVLRMRSGTTAN